MEGDLKFSISPQPHLPHTPRTHGAHTRSYTHMQINTQQQQQQKIQQCKSRYSSTRSTYYRKNICHRHAELCGQLQPFPDCTIVEAEEPLLWLRTPERVEPRSWQSFTVSPSQAFKLQTTSSLINVNTPTCDAKAAYNYKSRPHGPESRLPNSSQATHA